MRSLSYFIPHLSEMGRRRLDTLRSIRVGIVGLGREGVDLARFLHCVGADVVVSDRADAGQLRSQIDALRDVPITYRIGMEREIDLLDCEEVFISPGVSRQVPVVAAAVAARISVSSATRLFFELCPGPIAGITGSSGKTTTTTMVGSILKASNTPSIVGGNIGVPMLGRLVELTPDTWTVLELSSFQLDDMTVSPRVGAVLNITPNHLDRHPDMADYVRAKGNVVLYQGAQDVAVLNADDPIASSLPHRSRTVMFSIEEPVTGTWLDGERFMLSREGERPTHLLARSELGLRGIHNVANALAAAAVASIIGSDSTSIANALRAFRPVPHRLEVVDTIGGVTFINDSIATSPERSMAALRSIDEPIVLIAGGRDKHLPMDDWAHLIGERARVVVLLGEATPLIREALRLRAPGTPLAEAKGLDEAVSLGAELAAPGDVVLLSPGCTSFDAFRDFEARGEAFRKAVAMARRRTG